MKAWLDLHEIAERTDSLDVGRLHQESWRCKTCGHLATFTFGKDASHTRDLIDWASRHSVCSAHPPPPKRVSLWVHDKNALES